MVNAQVRAAAVQWPAPHSPTKALWLHGTGLTSWAQSPFISNGTSQLTFWTRRNQANQGTGSLVILHSSDLLDWVACSDVPVTNDTWQLVQLDVSMIRSGALRLAQATAGTVNFAIGLDDVSLRDTPVIAPPNALISARRQCLPSSRRTPLTISEIMYHPPARTDGQDLEFVEIFNSEPVSQDLSGFRLAGDVDYLFPTNTRLNARAHLVIARDPAALQATYGITNVFGPYTNDLPNDRGRVRLRNEQGAILLDVSYRDEMPWPVAADGAGASLQLARPDFGEDDVRAWDASPIAGGSPGTPDPEFHHRLDGLVINECLAHTDLPELDFIELCNTTAQTQDLSGCTLSDTPDTDKFSIPAGTRLPPGGTVAYTQTQLGFSLSSHGDDVILRAPQAYHVLDAVRFGAQANGVATGRHPDGAPGWHALQTPTPGAPNAPLRIDDVLINEIMFAPISGHDADEYIELYNRGTQTVSLANWRFLDGIDFAFPPGTTIAPDHYLVVVRDVTNALAHYPQLQAGNTVGDYRGQLSDRGERIVLAKPDDPALPYQDFVVVDEVTYGDGWSEWADGGGSSLELIDPRADHRLAMNWAASDESAKAPWTAIERTGTLAYGSGAAGELQVTALQASEFLIDDVVVITPASANAIVNSDFEAGRAGWAPRGNHVRSSIATGGYASAQCLHVRASGRGDVSGSSQSFTWQNHVAGTLSPIPSAGATVTIRAQARWQRGWPFATLSLSGDWMEAPVHLALPANLGTPGQRNSSARPNAAPSIADVAHSPLLPATQQSVRVTCRLDDPDGIAAATVRYRLDPATNTVALPLLDDGTAGDTLAGDGVYTATLPGQPAAALIAFRIEAFDGNATSAFPLQAANECLVRFGETPASGVFGAYHLWLTQTNRNLWAARDTHDNEPISLTLVYDGARAIYEAAGRYRGGWRLFDGPDGPTMCAYALELPKAERLHGDAEIKLDMTGHKDRDGSRQVERFCQWLARRLGQPYNNLRLVNVWVNGSQRHPLHEYQTPALDFLHSWFPDDPDHTTFKQMNEHALERFVGTDGAPAQWYYRDRWKKRRTNVPDDDFSRLYGLVDAFNLGDSALYTARTSALANMPNWMAYFAINHVVANKDSWGYDWHHNASAYLPPDRPALLFLYDMDMAFEEANTSDLFRNDDPVSLRMYNHAPYRRLYWRVLKEAANGPLLAEQFNPLFDELDAAMSSNSMLHSSTISTKSWLTGRRTFILNALATVAAPFAVTSNGGADFAVDAPRATLAGTAPVDVDTIRINGRVFTPAFPGVTTWTLTVPLAFGANALTLEALDRVGAVIGSDSLTVTATVAPPPPAGSVVISEIMYHAPQPHADYLELFNRSATESYDLSGCQLTGVDFVFPPGSFIAPRQSRVVADNLTAYAQIYTNAEVVLGAYNGELDNDGERLALLAPGADSNAWLALDEVCYDDAPPWPASADGQGSALQLIDPDQDNSRPGNWAAVDRRVSPSWKFAAVTGLSTGGPLTMSSATLCLSLLGAGQAMVDQVCLVSGSVAQVGGNVLRNGDFEDPLEPDWQPSGNHAGSTNTAEAVYTGSQALKLIATGAGSPTNHTVKQADLGLAKATTYTLSYWYWPQPGAGTLTVEVTQTALQSTQSVAQTPPSEAAYTPGTSNSLAAALPEFPPLWLTEVMTSNTATTVDNLGEYDPWLELFNAGTNAIDLTAYYLSDSFTNLRRWSFPAGASIAAGERVIVWLDGEPGETAANAWHTSFDVNAASGTVTLARGWQERAILVDAITYGPLAPDTSYGSYPDGDPLTRIVFHAPSPGQVNSPVSLKPSIRINEWLADNAHTLPDAADGRFQDWIELHNAGVERVHLGGFQLTDNPASSNRFVIPGGIWIEGEGFLLIWADNQPGQNQAGRDLHVDFSLNKDGEAIALFAPDGTPLDSVAFGPQSLDTSEGLWPDGAGLPQALWIPTPGSSNMVFTIHDISGTATLPPTVQWPTRPGCVYRIESVGDLTSGVWRVESVITASTTIATFTDTNAVGAPCRYYRLAEEP
ncbi:MAG: lamin tail domain-containing protein [Lentisphaerae bacterium]|nr:lamin tail domain-containing protein [Lentisphaerota bacterium]